MQECDIEVRALEILSNVNAKFKSYKLTVPVSKFKDLFNEDMWPEGVCVRKFIPPRSGDSRNRYSEQ